MASGRAFSTATQDAGLVRLRIAKDEEDRGRDRAVRSAARSLSKVAAAREPTDMVGQAGDRSAS